MPQNSENTEIQLQEYLNLLWKRKWSALVAFCVVVVPVLGYILLLQQKEFEATAVLIVKMRNRQAELFEDRPGPITESDVDTEIEVMKSPAVLGPAAAVFEAAGLDPAGWLREVEWTRIEETPVVHITTVAPTPAVARDAANTIGESYINYSQKSQLDTTRSTLVWLERQLAEAKAQVRRDEQKLSDFRNSHPNALVNAGSLLDSDYRQSMLNQHMEVQLEQAAARKELEEYGKLLTQCGIPLPGSDDDVVVRLAKNDEPNEGQAELLAALADSERLTEISAALDAAKAALQEKMQTLKEQHPDVVELKQQVAILQKHKQAAFLTECQRAYVVRRARVAALDAIVQAKKDELAKIRRQAHQSSGEQMQYEELQQNLEASRMLQNVVLVKLKEFDVAQGAAQVDAQFIQRAPIGRIKNPHNGIKIAFALLCGLVIAAGAALASEYFDTSLKTAEEIEFAFDLPVFGVVPENADDEMNQDDDSDILIALD